jgi:hypothetical protein
VSAREGETATMVALRVLEVALPLGVATVQAIRAAIEASRPDVRIADPPPASRYAEILAEDEETIARRFGGRVASTLPPPKGDNET